MEVVFKDKDLERVAEGWIDPKRPVGVCTSLQRKISLLRSAPDERTLRNWKSFHYEKLKKGNFAGKHSIRINDQYRLIFDLSVGSTGPKIIVINVVDYH